MTIIDYGGYPDIVERIFAFACADTDTLIALRGVSKSLLMEQYDDGLWLDVAIGVRHVVARSGIDVFPTLYAPHLRKDGSPIRLPLDIDFARHGLDPTRPNDSETSTDRWPSAGPAPENALAEFPGGNSSMWVGAVMNLFRTSIVDPFNLPDEAIVDNPRMWQAPAGCLPGMLNLPGRRVPLMRFAPVDTPSSRGEQVRWPKVTATWISVQDGPELFWGAVQGQADHIDVTLALNKDGVPRAYFDPPRSLNFHAAIITISLLAPPEYLVPQLGGGYPPLVPASTALGLTLGMFGLLASADGYQINILGQEMLDIPPELKHPNSAQHPYIVHGGPAFIRRVHADYWLRLFMFGIADSAMVAEYGWNERVANMQHCWERGVAEMTDAPPFSLGQGLACYRWTTHSDWVMTMPEFSARRVTKLQYPADYLQRDLHNAVNRQTMPSTPSQPDP